MEVRIPVISDQTQQTGLSYGVSLMPAVPAGMIMPFAGNGTPEGWSVCDGGELSRTDYADLFAAIGTTYGEGNGSTTFNKPNFIDKTIWGGVTAGVEKAAGLPDIEGSFNASSGFQSTDENTVLDQITTTGSFSAPNVLSKAAPNMTTTTRYRIANYVFTASRSNSIYGNSTTVQPPAITVRMMIKL